MATQFSAAHGLRAMLAAIVLGVLIALTQPPAITATPLQQGAFCDLDGHLHVEPTSVPVGGIASVTLTAGHRCAKRQIAIGFGTIAAYDRAWRGAFLEEAARWLRRVDLASAEVALVAMAPPEVVQPLTSDRTQLTRSMGEIPNEYFGQPHKTIEQTRLELLRGRVAGVRPDQALVILGDQIHSGQEADASEQANLAKAAGIEFYATGIAPHYGQLVSSPRHFFEVIFYVPRSAAEASAKALRAVDKTIEPRGFASSVVTATVPATMQYVAGSSVPAAQWDPQRRVLVWSHAQPSGVITMTFQVQAEVCGPVTVGDGSFATGLDLAGQMYRHDYIGQPIDVPCASPTPEPSPTPTATTVPTATATSTATATPLPGPVYLPLALAEVCRPGRARMDVALAIDASTSMLQPTSTGRTKLSAAVEAVAALLDQLRFAEGEQAAIVAFNAKADLLQALTGNRDDLTRAHATIQPAMQTCLVCAVDVAADELASERHRAGNVPVLILLTDGQSNPRPASEAVVRAAAAKSDGIVVFTIGLGDELDAWALEAMASKPSYFYRAPDAEHLAAIYAAIAVEIACPAEDFWGTRP